MASAAGVPLYRSRGYEPVADVGFTEVGGARVPLLHMDKRLCSVIT